MMRLSSCIVLIAALGMSSCLGHKKGSREYMSDDKEALLKADCSQMRAIGNYRELKADFDKNVDELLDLADQAPKDSKDQISNLADKIEDDVSRLQALTLPQWNLELWKSNYVWQLSAKDFGWPGKYVSSDDFEIRSIEVVRGSVFGRSPASDLSIEIGANSQQARLSIEIPSTSFELCELSRSIAYVVRVKYLSEGNLIQDNFALTAEAY